MELRGDDGVLDEELEGDDFEGVLVGGFEDDRAGGSGSLDCEPALSADTPTVAGFEALETVLRHRCNEVVAESAGGFEEGLVDDAADGVYAVVVRAGIAAAVAVEAGVGFPGSPPQVARGWPRTLRAGAFMGSTVGISSLFVLSIPLYASSAVRAKRE